MWNLPLGHPLASDDWNPVWGTSLPFLCMTTKHHSHNSSSSLSLLALLGDSLSSSMSWSSPSGCSGSCCLSQLPSPPHDELARFVLLVGLNLISGYQLCKRGASSSIHANTIYSCWVLMLMVHLFVLSNNLVTCSIIDEIATLFIVHESATLGKMTSLLTTHVW